MRFFSHRLNRGGALIRHLHTGSQGWTSEGAGGRSSRGNQSQDEFDRSEAKDGLGKF